MVSVEFRKIRVVGSCNHAKGFARQRSSTNMTRNSAVFAHGDITDEGSFSRGFTMTNKRNDAYHTFRMGEKINMSVNPNGGIERKIKSTPTPSSNSCNNNSN